MTIRSIYERDSRIFKGYITIRQTAALMKLDLSMSLQKSYDGRLNGKMHKRERLAQRASQAIATLVSPITNYKGQGFYIELI